jgi:hypothetical protein
MTDDEAYFPITHRPVHRFFCETCGAPTREGVIICRYCAIRLSERMSEQHGSIWFVPLVKRTHSR